MTNSRNSAYYNNSRETETTPWLWFPYTPDLRVCFHLFPYVSVPFFQDFQVSATTSMFNNATNDVTNDDQGCSMHFNVNELTKLTRMCRELRWAVRSQGVRNPWVSWLASADRCLGWGRGCLQRWQRLLGKAMRCHDAMPERHWKTYKDRSSVVHQFYRIIDSLKFHSVCAVCLCRWICFCAWRVFFYLFCSFFIMVQIAVKESLQALLAET